MKPTLIIIGILFCLGLVVLFVRSRIAPTYHASANEIPAVISQLQQSSKDGHFAVLMFIPPGATDGESANLQFSIEQGTVGFDWVLLGPRNIADKTKIIEHAASLGIRLEEHEMNNVRYLRTTGADINKLGITIIRDIYKIDPNTKLELITEGFQWQPFAP